MTHRPLNEILEDLDAITTNIAAASISGEDLDDMIADQERIIGELNSHPDNK